MRDPNRVTALHHGGLSDRRVLASGGNVAQRRCERGMQPNVLSAQVRPSVLIGAFQLITRSSEPSCVEFECGEVVRELDEVELVPDPLSLEKLELQ